MLKKYHVGQGREGVFTQELVLKKKKKRRKEKISALEEVNLPIDIGFVHLNKTCAHWLFFFLF